MVRYDEYRGLDDVRVSEWYVTYVRRVRNEHFARTYGRERVRVRYDVRVHC